MSHWVTRTVFNYYVSKMSGIRKLVDMGKDNARGRWAVKVVNLK